MLPSSGFLPEMDVFGEAVWWNRGGKEVGFLKACGIGKERLEKRENLFPDPLVYGNGRLRSGKD